MKTVQDILDQKGRIDPLEPVFAAAKLMRERRVGLPVQIDGYILGIVSERDL